MKNLLIATCLALTVSACASTPSGPTPASAAATARTSGCVPTSTPAWTSNACQNASTYKQREWQQMGATSTGDALQAVAPYTNVH